MPLLQQAVIRRGRAARLSRAAPARTLGWPACMRASRRRARGARAVCSTARAALVARSGRVRRACAAALVPCSRNLAGLPGACRAWPRPASLWRRLCRAAGAAGVRAARPMRGGRRARSQRSPRRPGRAGGRRADKVQAQGAAGRHPAVPQGDRAHRAAVHPQALQPLHADLPHKEADGARAAPASSAHPHRWRPVAGS